MLTQVSNAKRHKTQQGGSTGKQIDNTDFVRWLSSVMETKQLNFKSVSLRTGISQSALSAWFNGRREPSREMILKLASKLETDPDPALRSVGLGHRGNKEMDLIDDYDSKILTALRNAGIKLLETKDVDEIIEYVEFKVQRHAPDQNTAFGQPSVSYSSEKRILSRKILSAKIASFKRR